MTRSEHMAQKINKKIKAWVKDRAKLVVAIDGYAGSGKTTVADFIAKFNPDALIVHLDDFIHHWKKRKQMIDEAKDKSRVFEYYWYRYGDLKRLIKTFKTKAKGSITFNAYDYDKNDFSQQKPIELSKNILVIEGILLFHPKHHVSKLWDKTIYLDIDPDKADRRRVAREKKKWGKSYIPEDHPDNWTKYYKEAYRRYIKMYKPQKNRDVVLKI